ncbi:glutamyl-tRNA reductase [Bacillus sp. FSL W7-1360]
MHTLVIGFDYKSAPVEIREKLVFTQAQLPHALAQLRATKSIMECIILSTCNRTEVYVVADQLHTGRHFTKTFLANWFQIDKEELAPYLRVRENDEAIKHLFRVVCGLHSMVIGETQILGQVKQAFLCAQKEKVTGTIFNQLFKQAVTLGKHVHSATDISTQAVSISYAAVELGKKIFETFAGKHVLILGAGKMAQLTATHIQASGAAHMMVMNRTEEKAMELATAYQADVYSFAHMAEALEKADVVISSTGSLDFVLTDSHVGDLLEKRAGRPLFMIDIAVPRDIEPALASYAGVHLYDIDDLQHIVDENKQERLKEVDKIEVLIADEIDAYKSWLHTLGVVPLITALREKALIIQGETMDSIERKLPHLSERDLKVLRKHTKSIVNQMLRDPLTHIKELAMTPDADRSLELVMNLFALEEQLKQANVEKDHYKSDTGKISYLPFVEGMALRM